MFQLIYDVMTTPQTLVAIFAALAVFATAYTLVQPMFERDKLAGRIKSVAVEREQIRARERARLAAEANRANLRREAQALHAAHRRRASTCARRWPTTRPSPSCAWPASAVRRRWSSSCSRALTLPLLFVAVAFFYVFFLGELESADDDQGADRRRRRLCRLLRAQPLHLQHRSPSASSPIKRAWPDALDLMLICVEAGMSLEAAFRKVAEEIGQQSVELAEELTLTTAELSYLPERRQAFENLSLRTGLETVRSVMTSLIQAERYGTPLGSALRVLAQENRDQRMNDAEKKAAALPPKLTVPMILFFLPVLMAVILGPAAIQIMHANIPDP